VGGRAIGPRSAYTCRPTQLLTKGVDRETSKNHDHGTDSARSPFAWIPEETPTSVVLLRFPWGRARAPHRPLHRESGLQALPPTPMESALWRCKLKSIEVEVPAMMFWNGGQWAFWQVGLMWVGMIAFWGLIVWAVYYFISTSTRAAQPPATSDSAQRILDERLARGEVDAEQYRQLLDTLSGGSSQRAGVGS
jgi:putative membrane protein